MSRRSVAAVAALLVSMSPSLSRADAPDATGSTSTARAPAAAPYDWQLALALGYALPLGAAEVGSHVADSTIGAVPVRIQVGRRLSPRFFLELGLAWGPTLPTLCATVGECFGSMGADLQLTLGARARLLDSGRWSMHAAAGAGWEWLSTGLEDGDASSTRRYHGPVLLAAEITGERALSSRFQLGPVLAGGLGTFVHTSLEAPGIDRGGAPDAVAVHGWLTVSLRLAAGI